MPHPTAGVIPYRRSYAPSGIIFREGEPGDCAYVIERGQVDIISGARRLHLARRCPGEIIGEMALIDDGPRSASAIAATDVQLIALRREQLRSRLERSDPLAHLLVRILLARTREMQRTLVEGEGTVLDRQCGSAPLAGIEEFRERVTLERELERAIRDEALHLLFQPIIELADRSIAGFEALIRWDHPTRGAMAPPAIVQLAEQSNLLKAMDHFLYRSAFDALACAQKQRDARCCACFMSINISPARLADDSLIADLGEALALTGAQPGCLKLEVTESGLIEDPERGSATLRALNARGFGIALDDFGTGYSSLNYLCRLPIDTLKLDRSFVSQLLTDSRTYRIVRGVLDMCRDLGIEVVAEGIETQAEAGALRRLGCRFGQGYLFHRPMPLEAALQVLALRPAPCI